MKTFPHAQKGAKFKAFGIIILVLVPVSFAAYITSCVESLGQFASFLGSTPVDPDSLIPQDNTKLATMATDLEFYLERDNLPLNYTLSALWNDTFTGIEGYGVSGDAAIWTGMTLAMAAFKYAVAKESGNVTNIQNATRLIYKMMEGVTLLLAVPNGGIGPDFSGILARGVSQKNWTITGHPIIHGFPDGNEADNIDVFDGTGEYSDWLWIGYPSLDQYSGIIMGLTVALAIVDDTWVQGRAKLLAIQIVEHFKRTSWYLVDANGRMTGQSLQYKTEHPGYWLLATLFMGVLADPDAYRDLYYHWAIDRGYADNIMLRIDLRMYTLFNYFSMNINWVILFAMTLFEQDPALRERYQRVITESMYPVAVNHRNAWYNMAYLLLMRKNDTAVQEDIADQLMRFGMERIPGQPNSTRVPERGLNSSGPNYVGLVNQSLPRIKFSTWLQGMPFFPQSSTNIGALLLDDEEYLVKPKTVDQYHSVDFLWQRTPFTSINYSPAQRQDSGLSFLLPYWMARYHGIIPEGI